MGEAADIEVRPAGFGSDGASPSYQKTSWTSINVQTAGPEGARDMETLKAVVFHSAWNLRHEVRFRVCGTR
jgi:hypothetical protein